MAEPLVTSFITEKKNLLLLSLPWIFSCCFFSGRYISLHIRNIFKEGELEEISVVKDYLTVQTEGKREVQRNSKIYNLDVVISVGYRVKSHRGTQFRIWATQQLKEFIVKGFVLNDEKLKEKIIIGLYSMFCPVIGLCANENEKYNHIDRGNTYLFWPGLSC